VQYTSFGMFFSNPAAFTHRISVFFSSDWRFSTPILMWSSVSSVGP
jgi:hypothetical protein